jgi:phage gp29-like protein
MRPTDRLKDWLGRVVRGRTLEAPQATPSLTGVRQPYADSVATGLTPVRLAQILAAADQGDILDFMTLAQEMEERDPHYAAVLGVRKRAVSGVPVAVVAAEGAVEDDPVAKAVTRDLVESGLLPDLVEDLMDGLGKGVSVVEIDWHRGPDRWRPRGFEWVDARFLQLDRETGREVRLRDEADLQAGVALEPFRFLVHRPALKAGLAVRGGLARLVAFMWLLKKYDEKDWLACIELFGMPLRLGKYGREATAEDIAALRRAVASIGTDAAAIVPEAMAIEFVEAMKGSGEPPYEAFARYADEQVSKAVLGQTMTSDNGSSQSQAEVHDSVRHDIAAADARAISATLNRDLVRPYVDLNFGPQAAYPRLVIEVAEPEDVDMQLTNAARLIAVGVPFKASELRRKAGFTDPREGDEVVGAASAPAPPSGPARVEANSLARDDPGPWALLGPLEAEVAAGWREAFEDMLAPIEERLEAARSPEDALRLVRELELPGAPLALTEQLARAAVMARGIGEGWTEDG